MLQTRSVIKMNARSSLGGKYAKPIVIMLIFAAIESLLTYISKFFAPTYNIETFQMIDAGNPTMVSVMSAVMFVFGAVVLYSFIKMSIMIARGEDFDIENILLAGVKENPIRNIFLQFMITLFTILWTFLFIIPGIVKMYAYSMSFYLVNKEPKLDAMTAIDKSKNYMSGFKMELFILDFSYLGWYILGLFTFGILWLWIYPQHLAARAMYYEEIYYSNNPIKPEPVVDSTEL